MDHVNIAPYFVDGEVDDAVSEYRMIVVDVGDVNGDSSCVVEVAVSHHHLGSWVLFIYLCINYKKKGR